CDVFINESETYNPNTGTWSQAGNLPVGRIGAAAVVLGDGRVLVVGGGTNAGPNNDALLFNPTTNQWTTTTPPPVSTQGSSAILLPDGRALVAGGGTGVGLIFDPATQTWALDAPT